MARSRALCGRGHIFFCVRRRQGRSNRPNRPILYWILWLCPSIQYGRRTQRYLGPNCKGLRDYGLFAGRHRRSDVGPTGWKCPGGELPWLEVDTVCKFIPGGNTSLLYPFRLTLGQLAGILQIAAVLVSAVVLDESYEPVLLIRKAKILRIKTGNWALHTEFEEWVGNVTPRYYLNKFGVRPVQMLLTPICFLVALHASFIFGVFYATLAAFPILFEQTRGWDPVSGSLPFLALLIGILLGAIVVALNQRYYNRAYHAAQGVVMPEARLPSMMVGSVIFAGGLFLIGWTADPTLPWIWGFIGAGCVGFGFFTIFQGALNYLLDVFTRWGASAIAANTFLRSTLAAVFPLFIEPMYQRLGNGGATSVFGGFAVLLIPIPFVFWRWGPRIRSSKKYMANVG